MMNAHRGDRMYMYPIAGGGSHEHRVVKREHVKNDGDLTEAQGTLRGGALLLR